jgi:hypothetical protein
MGQRGILILTVIAAVATFAVVQDRVTAAGARRYVALQRSALAGAAEPVSIDEVVRPAVRRSVWYGALSGTAVLVAGLAVAGVAGRRRLRE